MIFIDCISTYSIVQYCILSFAYKTPEMVKKSSKREHTAAPLASLESLMSIESAADDKMINWVTWSEETPWTAPDWDRKSLNSQNCQIYRVSHRICLQEF